MPSHTCQLGRHHGCAGTEVDTLEEMLGISGTNGSRDMKNNHLPFGASLQPSERGDGVRPGIMGIQRLVGVVLWGLWGLFLLGLGGAWSSAASCMPFWQRMRSPCMGYACWDTWAS